MSVDLTGQRFGRLVVESFSHYNPKYRYNYWNCKCDCGINSKVPTTSLKRKKNPTQSCSCYRLDQIKKLVPHNKLGYGDANSRSLYQSYKKAAKDRYLQFNIPYNQFLDLTKGNCYYCGIPPAQVHIKKETNGPYIYNGLDRIDSNSHYDLNNVVSCCKGCNYAKREMSQKEFQIWVQTVYNHFAKTICT